jgi:hypothetical protein
MKDQSNDTKNFDEKDIDLLIYVISLIPDLDLVAYAGKLVRDKIKYPIKDYDSLQPLFGGKRVANYADRKITFAQAERFIPKEFFPIVSERDLLCKLIMVFQRGNIIHAQEAIASDSRAAMFTQAKSVEKEVEVTILPSPSVG